MNFPLSNEQNLVDYENLLRKFQLYATHRDTKSVLLVERIIAKSDEMVNKIFKAEMTLTSEKTLSEAEISNLKSLIRRNESQLESLENRILNYLG